MKIHLLIQDSLCLYTQHKSEIEKGIIVNLRKLEEDVKDLKDNIDKYSREYNVVKFYKDIMILMICILWMIKRILKVCL